MNFFFRKAGLLLIFLLGLKYQIILAQNRIIGGHTTTIARFPHMLRLQVGRKNDNLISACGASIIGNEWALTAAHCFDNNSTDFNKISVIAGTANIRNLEKTAKFHKVIRVIRHELYRGIGANQNIAGDIAVMKISPPFTYSNVIQPVRLPQRGVAMKTDFATISGWGNTWPKGKSPDVLLAVIVPKVNTEQCRLQYLKGQIKLKQGEICYGFNNGTVVHDKCQGDSGGPLVNSDRIELGIVSYGVECGTKVGYPGVYTDVLFFRDWIKQKTGI